MHVPLLFGASRLQMPMTKKKIKLKLVNPSVTLAYVFTDMTPVMWLVCCLSVHQHDTCGTAVLLMRAPM